MSDQIITRIDDMSARWAVIGGLHNAHLWLVRQDWRPRAQHQRPDEPGGPGRAAHGREGEVTQ